MKTLEQLGISPAPWRINDHASVLDRYCEIISGQYGPYNWHNAHLIVAAPKLYAALYELLGDACQHCDLRGACQEGEDGMSAACNAVQNARAALAEASGERVQNENN